MAIYSQSMGILRFLCQKIVSLAHYCLCSNVWIFFFLNRDSILILPTLKESVFQNYDNLAAPLREDFDEGQIERIFKVNNVNISD